MPAVGLVALVLAATGHVANASTAKVTNCNDSGPGSLREAINATDVAGGRNSIKFAVDCPSSSPILLNSGLDVTGSPSQTLSIVGRGRDKTVLDGQFATDILSVGSGATVVVSDLTIRNGRSDGGGGISNSGTLTIKRSTLSGNVNPSVNNGGGIFNNGTLSISNSTFSGNLAYDGGGIANQGTLSISSSTFSGNGANEGGGIFNDGTLTIKRSTFSGNNTGGNGGGIDNLGTLTVTGSTFSGNTSDGGDGGGIDNLVGATAHLTSSTVTGNTAYGEGGGISNANTPGSVTLTRTVVAGNSPDDCHPAIGICTD